WIAESASQGGALARPTTSLRARHWLAWAVGAAGIIAALVLGIIHFRETLPLSEPVRFTVSAPTGTALAPLHPYGAPVVSPDGRKLAFVAKKDGQPLLHVHSLESLETRALAGTADAYHPFWSPDSRTIGFFADGKLKRIDVSGGLPLTLCSVSARKDNQGKGATWNRDGAILFAMVRG